MLCYPVFTILDIFYAPLLVMIFIPHPYSFTSNIYFTWQDFQGQKCLHFKLCFLHSFSYICLIHMCTNLCINMLLSSTCFRIIKDQNSYQICLILFTQRASQPLLHVCSIVHKE